MKKTKLLLTLIGSALTIITVNAQIINTYAGTGAMSYSGDGGQATNATFNGPRGLAADMSGNVYVTDYYNNVVRKIDAFGVVSTWAGSYSSPGYYGDGGPATAAGLNEPLALAIDNAGNIYIADELNNCIRKVNTSGIISTVAGNGSGAYSGDGGQATAASISWPAGIWVDGAGNMLIADYANDRIRKVNAAGIISTLAGTGTNGYSGDGGPSTAAQINWPHGITEDPYGNIYFGDSYNNCIRVINTSGIINTFAGNGAGGNAGDGGPATAAELNLPVGVIFDATGSLYISDYQNSLIRVVSPTGIINTWAGIPYHGGFSGDGGPATAAEIYYPYGVAFDPNSAGTAYISDAGNYRIRSVTHAIVEDVKQLQANNANTVLFPNPNNGSFQLAINPNNQSGSKYNVEVYNMLGEKVYSANANSGLNRIDMSSAAKGIYLCRILTAKGELIRTQKLIIE